MFRFSLKWILAAMVYAAVAAAAFSQESWVYPDLLGAATLLALGYAVMLIIYARGARQAAAAGFVTFTVLLAIAIVVAPNSVPTQRILIATGIGQSPILPTPAMPQPVISGSAIFGQAPVYPSPANNSTWTLMSSPTVSVTAVPATPPVFSFYDMASKLRAANAVASMLCGLIGALLAMVAYRRTREINSAPPLATGGTP